MKPIYVPESRLDPNQRRVYDLRLDVSCIVQGCAGSGKTSLAMLRMQQWLAETQGDPVTKFYYVAFVRELVECVRRDISKCQQMSSLMTSDDFLITYQNWCDGRISDWMRKKFNISPNEGMKRLVEKEWNGRVYTNVDIEVNKHPDYLFVDECQDLEMDAIQDLVKSAQNGIAFYGDDAQHIMNWNNRHPVKLEDIQKTFPGKFPEIYPLLRNYRLPKEIAAFAQEIGGMKNLAAHCRSPYHEKPVVATISTVEKLLDYMVTRINNIGLQDVAVVVSTNEVARGIYRALAQRLGSREVSASWDINSGPGCSEGEDYAYLDDTRVKVMTYEKVKGQQFETVFLLALEEMDAEQIKRFYVGATRAERFLYVLCSELPAFLRQVPRELYNTTDENVRFEGLYRPGEVPDEPNSGATEDGSEEDW